MAVQLYNTLTKRKEEFVPLEGDVVRMYTCGPTVYDRFHIGNARTFIIFDVFRQYLEKFKGYKVIYAQNITDVDDKIINKAAALSMDTKEVAERYTKAYFEDLKQLGVEKADYHPKATEKIEEIIAFVKELVKRGYAYEVDGDVYYRVSKFSGYGKLSGRRLEELESGARVEVDERKENPLDFALWKRSKGGEPKWESPWGQGRPGWHIECSVMAISTLGETIDIHGGGADLVFPHHEDEIAQVEAKTGKPFARYWMHNELLKYKGEKMSKSLGNSEYAKDVVAQYGKEAVRLFYLSKHYRKPINFTHEAMEDAKVAVGRVYNLLEEIEFELERSDGGSPELDEDRLTERGREFKGYLATVEEEYKREMDDDLNTAGAIGAIFDLVRKANIFKQNVVEEDLPLLLRVEELIRKLGEPLGLFQEELPKERVRGIQEELIELLIETRDELRAKKEWGLADRIRAQLKALGIVLKDKEEGTIWSFED